MDGWRRRPRREYADAASRGSQSDSKAVGELRGMRHQGAPRPFFIAYGAGEHKFAILPVSKEPITSPLASSTNDLSTELPQ